MSTKGTKMRN